MEKSTLILFLVIFLMSCQNKKYLTTTYEGLLYATINLAEENNWQYSGFYRRNLENPEFVIGYKSKADTFKTKTEKLCEYINNERLSILKRNNLKDDEKVPNEIIHSKTSIDRNDFISQLIDYKNYTLSNIENNKRTEFIINAINDLIPIDDIEHLDFTLIDLLAVENIIRNVEFYYINYLYAKIDDCYFKLRKPTVEVQPISPVIKKGGEFRANIFMTVMDTAIRYNAFMENETGIDTLMIENGIAIFIDSTLNTGYVLRKGYFEIETSFGQITELPFKIEYNVE